MHLLDKILDKNIDPEIFLALKNELLELDKLRQENHAYEIQNKVYFTRIEELSSVVSQQATQIKMNQFKIDQLIFDLARKKHLLYAAKNESMSAEQRTLFEEDFKTDIAAIEAELTELNQAQNSTPRQKEKPIRSALPAHLPRIKIVHEPASCTCEQCGDALVKIGEDISEKLDIKPAEFFVLHNIYMKYACRACEVIRTAPVPPAVIDSGIAAPGLLAWIMVSKYVDHLPLYRLEKIAARQGVALSLSSMSEWVGKTGVLLDILGQRLADKLRVKTILHADETPVQQLAPGEGKTRRAYLWAYRSSVHDSDPPIVIFDYQSSRAGKYCVTFLKDWKGSLMVDDYGGYKILFKMGATELGCWAHARRKFHELQLHESPIAKTAMQFIAALYHIESETRELSCEARQQIRHNQAKPLLEKYKTWLDEIRLKVPNGSGTANALDYTLRRWPALVRYADSGDLPIDNNPIENAIRPIALGRKNWLFTGSEQAGKRAASIQSLFATAKANEIDPYLWLKETLEKLPSCTAANVDELLPLRKI